MFYFKEIMTCEKKLIKIFLIIKYPKGIFQLCIKGLQGVVCIEKKTSIMNVIYLFIYYLKCRPLFYCWRGMFIGKYEWNECGECIMN